jgi:L-amino acid N-acyltransferase YncA
MFRRAGPSDADAIANIYNQAMKAGVFATPQITPVTREDRLAWLSEHHDPFPAFVYESGDGKVIAWCSLSRFSARPEYTGIAEISRYVDERFREHGLGKLMLAHLIDAAKTLALRALVSRAIDRNVGSIKSSTHFGFRQVALLHECSRVRGEWFNEVWLWKTLV